MGSTLLQQVRLLDPGLESDRITDVLISNGQIAAIAPEITTYPDDTQILNGDGMILGPGLVDLYSHSGEPGYESRETLASLQQAAIAGGFTRLAILPDTTPVIDNPAILSAIQRQWQQSGQPFATPQLHLWGSLTVDGQGQQIADLAELAQAGILGFTHTQPIQNHLLLRRSLEYARPLGKPIALSACDLSLVGNGVMRECPDSIRFGLPGIPAIAETTALAALLEMVAELGTPVHIMRLSTARSVELISHAKSQGLPVTASTTWMHLLLNTEAIATYDPNLRLDPPLGTPGDQLALQHAVKTGIIDAIAIDHSPYTYEEKTVAFAEAPAGAIGLELALPLLWQHFVVSGEWTALDLWRILSRRAALVLGQTPPTLEPGQPAELTLFDPSETWMCDRTTLKSLANNTPWLGQTLTGKVIQSWC